MVGNVFHYSRQSHVPLVPDAERWGNLLIAIIRFEQNPYARKGAIGTCDSLAFYQSIVAQLAQINISHGAMSFANDLTPS